MAVTLQTTHGLIVLPNPQDEDNEGLEASIQVHTSVTNVTRVYQRTKGYRRFVMTFVIHPRQAEQLQIFLQENLHLWLVLTDYFDRKWRAIITTNPVEFVAHKRGRESVTLDFLGAPL